MFVIAKGPSGPFLCGKPDETGVLHPSWVSHADSASVFHEEEGATNLMEALTPSEGSLALVEFSSLDGSCFKSGLTPKERKVRTHEVRLPVDDRHVRVSISVELEP